MNLTPCLRGDYDNKSELLPMQKQTQTKPILPAMAGKIALSEAEGPVLRDLSRQLRQICLLFRFAAVFGAQDADERIKEERQNRQPA
jgi:hypothetical protein